MPGLTAWAIMTVVHSLSNIPLLLVAAVPTLSVMMRHTPSGTVGKVGRGGESTCVTSGTGPAPSMASKSVLSWFGVCDIVRSVGTGAVLLCANRPILFFLAPRFLTTLFSVKRIVSEPLTRKTRYPSSSSLSVSFLS